MRRQFLIAGLAVFQMVAVSRISGAVVLDRVAVIVGKHAIKASDIDRDIRVTAFLNKTNVDQSADSKSKSADRLVNQSMIRDEIATGDYERASDAAAVTMLSQIRRDRFGSSDARLRQELVRYGLTEDEVKDALLWQLTVLQFIDERFRPAAEGAGQGADAAVTQNANLGNVEKEVDKQFDLWLAEKRKAERIVFRTEALK